MNKAKEWIDKASAMRKDPAYWMYRQKSLIHATMGDKKGAIAAAKTSLDLAKEAGNKDYISLNEKSLKVSLVTSSNVWYTIADPSRYQSEGDKKS